MRPEWQQTKWVCRGRVSHDYLEKLPIFSVIQDVCCRNQTLISMLLFPWIRHYVKLLLVGCCADKLTGVTGYKCVVPNGPLQNTNIIHSIIQDLMWTLTHKLQFLCVILHSMYKVRHSLLRKTHNCCLRLQNFMWSFQFIFQVQTSQGSNSTDSFNKDIKI